MEKPEKFRTSTGLELVTSRSNQLSYEATDGGSWSFVSSNVPVMNESMDEMMYEINHILNCGYEIK